MEVVVGNSGARNGDVGCGIAVAACELIIIERVEALLVEADGGEHWEVGGGPRSTMFETPKLDHH